MPDISSLEGTFATAQLIAVGVIIVVVAGLAIVLRARAKKATVQDGSVASPDETKPGWRLVVGYDNRLSTSQTTVFLWTLVVAYNLLTLSLIALAPVSTTTPTPAGSIPPDWASAAFATLSAPYWAALGLPVVAAVASKGIVTAKKNAGTVVKPSAASPSLADLVANDAGDLDLGDFQYLVFNLVAIFYVLSQFITHPSRGIVDIPVTLAVLSGLSAGVYTVKKAVEKNGPQLTSILTPSVSAGGEVYVTGTNLTVGDKAGDQKLDPTNTKVHLAHAKLPSPKTSIEVATISDDQLSFVVPADTEAGVGWTIVADTPAGGTAKISGLTVVATTVVAPTKSTASGGDAASLNMAAAAAPPVQHLGVPLGG